MISVIVLTLIVICASETSQTNFSRSYLGFQEEQCIADHLAVDAFRTEFDVFTINLIRKAAFRGNNFLIISPYSIWITLAAISEGSDENTQKELFELLNLPKSACSRQKIYQVAATRISATKYVNVFSNRVLLLEESAHLNPQWYNLVKQYSLLEVIRAPIKRDPTTTTEIVNRFMSKKHELDFKGNSILLNSLDYDGLWTTAFAGAVIERSPFYSQGEQRVGSVDLMRIKKRARIGYVTNSNAKILELPVGINGEYKMVFGLVVDSDPNIEPLVTSLRNFTIKEAIASLQDSYLPIEIAIPRFVMTSEIDVKQILQDMGVVKLWQNPGATRYISNPPAFPTSYVQRTTVTLKSNGIFPQPFEYPSYQHATDEERYWSEFVADRPFTFALLDSETYTCLMVAMFSKPTYPY